MLILGLAIERSGRGFQDMGGGRSALGHAPAAGVDIPVERKLGLSAGEAELAVVTAESGCSGISDQKSDALIQLAVGNPVHGRLLRLTEQMLYAIWCGKLDGSGAILSDILNQAERVSRRDTELLPPTLEHHFVVGQQAPQERLRL